MKPYPEWLESAVIYQIYPQSFQDSNGDGIGDLRGIESRIPYLAELGITVIWLNPIFDSPFADAGYDIRDYFKIAPRYGSEEDLISLFKTAEKHGIRVVLDLVAGHSSIEHPLFQESAHAPEGPQAQQYIWMNRDYDPREGPTERNYVHNFFPFQPALNFGYAHPAEPWQDPVDAPGPTRNRAMLREILAYWMDLGAAGFRVDMASSLVKEDPGVAKTITLWQELRAWWDERYPDRVLIAEWSDPAKSVPAGFHLDFLMHFNVDAYGTLFFNETGTFQSPDGTCYFDAQGNGSPHTFMSVYTHQLAAVLDQGFISLPTSNHDFQRLRCGSRGWEGLRVAWTFLMTQAGPPTIFMGDEIGMRFVPDTPPKEGSTLVGITAPNGDSVNGERSGTRTPMQWDASPNNGFSEAPEDQLYLPMDPDPDRPTVAAQEIDPNSLLHFVRNLIQLRNKYPALGAKASYECLNDAQSAYPLIIRRSTPEQSCLILLNPSGRQISYAFDCALTIRSILLNEGTSVRQDDPVPAQILFDPFACAMLEVRAPGPT